MGGKGGKGSCGGGDGGDADGAKGGAGWSKEQQDSYLASLGFPVPQVERATPTKKEIAQGYFDPIIPPALGRAIVGVEQHDPPELLAFPPQHEDLVDPGPLPPPLGPGLPGKSDFGGQTLETFDDAMVRRNAESIPKPARVSRARHHAPARH